MHPKTLSSDSATLKKVTPNRICDKKTYFSVKTLKLTKIIKKVHALSVGGRPLWEVYFGQILHVFAIFLNEFARNVQTVLVAKQHR